MTQDKTKSVKPKLQEGDLVQPTNQAAREGGGEILRIYTVDGKEVADVQWVKSQTRTTKELRYLKLFRAVESSVPSWWSQRCSLSPEQIMFVQSHKEQYINKSFDRADAGAQHEASALLRAYGLRSRSTSSCWKVVDSYLVGKYVHIVFSVVYYCTNDSLNFVRPVLQQQECVRCPLPVCVLLPARSCHETGGMTLISEVMWTNSGCVCPLYSSQ